MAEISQLLAQTYFDNSLARWLQAGVLALGILLVVLAVRNVLTRRLGRWSDRTDTSIDDSLVAAVKATHALCVAVVALFVGSWRLELPAAVRGALTVALKVAVVLQIGLWVQRGVSHAVDRWSQRYAEDTARKTTGKAIGFAVKLGLWSFVALFVLSNLGIEIGALAAGLGIGGIAAALAVQNVLGELLASLSIYVDRPFDIGDFIVVDDYMGTVEQVRWRSTRIRSLDGEQIVFSNADLARSRVRNYGRMQERRVVFQIGIEYNLPVERVRQASTILREVIEARDGVRFDRAHFKAYGDFALLFEAVYYVLTSDYNAYMDMQQAINLALYERFEAAGIPFAYPARTLFVRQEQPWLVRRVEPGGEAAPSGGVGPGMSPNAKRSR